MQPSDVRAYGCDYSAREFTPQEMNLYPGVKIEWLARYIGYPGNPKCISHYPGAYKRHRDAGRPVVLFHQIEYRDFEGGYEKGRGHAQVALDDAKRQGWNGETPILACFDRRMPAFTRGNISYRAIWIDEVRDYVRGFKSVLGYEDSGFYGFEDTMGPCVRENWVRFRMQCGARSAHIQGITSWQENNVQPLLLGTQTDRLELYIPLAELAGGDDLVGITISDIEDAAYRAVTNYNSDVSLGVNLTGYNALSAQMRDHVVGPIKRALAEDDDFDEAALANAVVVPLTAKMIEAIKAIDFTGMGREQIIEALQEAMRRGTGS